MNLTQNPLQSEATGEATKTVSTDKTTKVEDTDLQLAQKIYSNLQEDIQRYLIEDYIKPQLEEGDKMIRQFHELIESEE